MLETLPSRAATSRKMEAAISILDVPVFCVVSSAGLFWIHAGRGNKQIAAYLYLKGFR